MHSTLVSKNFVNGLKFKIFIMWSEVESNFKNKENSKKRKKTQSLESENNCEWFSAEKRGGTGISAYTYFAIWTKPLKNASTTITGSIKEKGMTTHKAQRKTKKVSLCCTGCLNLRNRPTIFCSYCFTTLQENGTWFSFTQTAIKILSNIVF